jgi:hypothetical protein
MYYLTIKKSGGMQFNRACVLENNLRAQCFQRQTLKGATTENIAIFISGPVKKPSLKVVRILVHTRPKDRNAYQENKAN